MGWLKREAAKPKLCINCEHFLRLGQQCSEPRNEKRDLVTGTIGHRNTPANMRSDANWAGSNGCGSEGYWFKARS